MRPFEESLPRVRPIVLRQLALSQLTYLCKHSYQIYRRPRDPRFCYTVKPACVVEGPLCIRFTLGLLKARHAISHSRLAGAGIPPLSHQTSQAGKASQLLERSITNTSRRQPHHQTHLKTPQIPTSVSLLILVRFDTHIAGFAGYFGCILGRRTALVLLVGKIATARTDRQLRASGCNAAARSVELWWQCQRPEPAMRDMSGNGSSIPSKVSA